MIPICLGMIRPRPRARSLRAPFMGPIATARVGYKDGEAYIINRTIDNFEKSNSTSVMAGTADAVMMVESEAY